MKKQIYIIALILCVVGIFAYAIQNSEFKTRGGSNKIRIVTSFYPMYIAMLNLTDNIDGVELKNLTKPTAGCLHDYQISPEEMIKLSEADVFVINGAGMEAFLEKVIQSLPELKIIDSSQDIIYIVNRARDNHEHHDHGKEKAKADDDYEINPHVWLSITRHIQQIRKISDELKTIDTRNAKKYEENANIYISKLESLKKDAHSVLDQLKNKEIITFHEAFPYFAEEFYIHVAATLEQSPETQPSAGEIKDLIKKIKKHKAKAIFAEPQYSADIALMISKETKIPMYTLDPIVTGSPDKDAYINIMRQNVDSLIKALK
jgi:zinc transport system substrate-binding protein